jgi:hypothetical protein
MFIHSSRQTETKNRLKADDLGLGMLNTQLFRPIRRKYRTNKKRALFSLFLLAILILNGSPAQGYDYQRDGFLLGAGLGVGHTSYKQELTISGSGTATSPTEYQFGIITDFKIGYAPEKTWAVYFTNKVSWFEMINVMDESVIIASGLSALAFQNWFKPKSPSGFITLGIGMSSWGAFFKESFSETWTGLGIFAGGGYEFSRGWSLEAYWIWGEAKDSISGISAKSETNTFMFTLNVLGY